MEKITTDIYSFENLRKDGFVYVDKTDRKGALKPLLDWYDSYRFAPDTVARVCNPISIGQALQTGNLKSYWVGTAVATLVMERITLVGINFRLTKRNIDEPLFANL